MHQYYPVTIYLAPVEYEALHVFCQAYASWVVNQPIAQITNTDLILADLYKRLFTPARIAGFTSVKRRKTGKRYPIKLGLVFARTLWYELTTQNHGQPLLTHVLGELAGQLTNAGDVNLLGIKHSS